MHDTKAGQIHDCLKLGEDFELDLRVYQLRVFPEKQQQLHGSGFEIKHAPGLVCSIRALD